MALKKLSLLILMIIIICVVSGCWDAVDINDKDIIVAAANDKKDGLYYFYAEIPNLSVSSESGEESGEKFSIVSGKGETFVAAKANLSTKLEKPLFLGTTRVVIFTRRMAEDGIDGYMYRLQNNKEYRKSVDIVTTSEEFEDLFAVEPENNISVGYAIEETIDNLARNGQAVTSSASDILEWLYSKNYCFVVPNVDIKDEHIALTGYSVIHHGKYHGFISFKESKGLVCFLNDQAKLGYVVRFRENEATVEIKLKKLKIIPSYENETVAFQVEFSFGAIVKYLDANVVLDEKGLSEVKKNLQEKILADLVATVQKAKALECDYLKFDEVFRIAYPDEYDEMDWSEAFETANVHIFVKATLDPGGMMDFEASGD